jgi:hypothetical protein
MLRKLLIIYRLKRLSKKQLDYATNDTLALIEANIDKPKNYPFYFAILDYVKFHNKTTALQNKTIERLCK